MRNPESPSSAGTATAITLAAILSSGSVAAANESEQQNESYLPPFPPPTELFAPPQEPFWGIDQALETNPIDLSKYEEEINRYKMGEIPISELPIGVARTIDPEKALKYITENQPRVEEVIFPDEISTFKSSTQELMYDIFIDEEDKEVVSPEYLGNSLNDFYAFYGENLAQIDIAGIELYTKDDLNQILRGMNYGDSYSQELANGDEENAEKIIDSSRLTTASALYLDLLLVYDVTKNPELRNGIKEEAEILANWAKDNIDSFSDEEIKNHMNGYANYMARNYRYKGAYEPKEE